jgi:two-component system sensor histidine kinase RegB
MSVQGLATPGRGIRVRDVVEMRAILLASQMISLMVGWKILGWRVPVVACLALMAVSTVLDLVTALWRAPQSRGGPWEVSAHLAFDVLQSCALLSMIGGILNPLMIALVLPVTLAGSALPPRHAAGIYALAMLSVLALTFSPLPRPWPVEGAGLTYAAYRLLCAGALIVTMSFAVGFSSWSSDQRARNALALQITETVLAREQRLSALGALAAAAAHELGTPLATIAVVAKEMALQAGEGAFKEDAWLLVEQAQRCRDILKRLAEKPDQSDGVHERMSLLDLVREVVDPYAGAQSVRVEGVVTGPPSLATPDLWRRQEILHALAALVENAYDFARGEILVTARFDAEILSIEVRDDGPGFSPQVLARLGEPYVTSRPGTAEGSRSGHLGLGLGFFIAKTLLERTGAQVTFRNGPKLGAIVTARWSRARIEAAEPT